MTASANLPLRAPYPGLRAFRGEEASVFCGRAQHRLEILDALADSRFLAVVGASGSGKSSLVLAGVLPDISSGHLIGVNPRTVQVVSMQPGSQPFKNLADALGEKFPDGIGAESFLRRGPLGVVQFLDLLPSEFLGALVIVVDQFEEIFRFSERREDDVMRELGGDGSPMLDGTLNESQAFVNLLIETSKQSDYPVYVMLTMRSEFLSNCDRFSGLPEAISRSQFLTPRLNRDQLEQAITRPLANFNAAIQPELVNMILNRISTEQDQLPRMQHALARMWEVAQAADDGKLTLTVAHFEAVGGLSNALNNHGDSLCDDLGKQGVPLASIEQFFRATAHHVTASIAPVRRPVKLGQIVAETGLAFSVVQSIANAFRAEGAHLLMPPTTKLATLGAENFVDISHESLLRQWRRLKSWMEKEWQQRKMAGELVEAMVSWKEATANNSRKPFSKFTQGWSAGEAVATRLYRDEGSRRFTEESSGPMAAWAGRYGIHWKELAAFCKVSFGWKKRLDASMLMGAALLLVLGLLVWVSIFAGYSAARAKAEAKRATEQEKIAVKQQRIANAETAKAVASNKEMMRANEEAQENLRNAVKALSEKDADLVSQRAVISSISQKIDTAYEKAMGNSPEAAEKLKELSGAVAVQGFAQTGVPQSSPDNSLPPVEPAGAFPSTVVLESGFPEAASKPKVAFLIHPDGLMLLAGAAGSPRTLLWNLTGGNGEKVAFDFESTRLKSVEDGKRVYSVGGAGKRLILGPNTVEPASETADDGAPARFAFRTDIGKPLELRISPFGADAPVSVLNHQTAVQPLRSLSRDGTMLATTDSEGRVYLWNMKYAPGKVPPPVILSGHKVPPSVLRWAPEDKFLLTAGDEGVPIVWQSPRARIDSRYNELPYVLPSHAGGVTDVAISPDLRRIATTGGDRIIRVFPIAPSIRGTAREWGGPDDKWGKGGDLALLSANDLNSEAFGMYFLPAQPPGTTGLIKRLNPDSFYVNSRWNYAITPRSVLRRTMVRIWKLDASGKPVGKPVEAQAVDWGPPASEGFACDVSPAVIKALNLAPADRVELEIPLLEVRRSDRTRKSAK